MKVEIWSDIHCPWCYIGKRRFEKALNQFEHRDQVDITWRSFQLDPRAPREYNGTLNDMLAEKKGISPERAQAMHEHVTALAAQEGLDYHFELARVGNSFDAHRLVHLAGEHDLSGKMQERLFRAYFTEGQHVGNADTLAQLAVEVGLDADEVRAMLASDAYAADVRADIQRAGSIGVSGVPFFLFDERYAISGAQPTELFTTALTRAWEDAQKVLP
jgi:predicted DsbA family dithiol-disulfide isomerase